MISALLQIVIYIIIIDVLLSWVPQMRSQPWARTLHKIADIPQKPIRDLLPKDLPLDPAPMIVIILIQMLMYIFKG
jgi:YggT family protein